ncbi:MAG: lipid-A-disaccharide synthase [Gammaproteobacteria bacterium]|nr:lipid-A-disaccharide synthase [Gammaproteobacteria bacterium]
MRRLRVAMVAGEASGDTLGAGLLDALRSRADSILAEGIGGPALVTAGLVSHYPMERLSVMGLVEAARQVPQLLRQRWLLGRELINRPPDLFVGIDSPDFNLRLERRLKLAGIPTVHYVSPSVWAWRRYRVGKIARSIDMLLTLFPFEAQFYQGYSATVRYVGHPLADRVPMEPDQGAARQALGLPSDGEIVALLPGSRVSEVRYLMEPMLVAARWLLRRRPRLRFAIPLVEGGAGQMVRQAVKQIGSDLPVTLVDGQSLQVMAAADAVLLASGTAALEAMLLKRPMVVTYRLSALSASIMRRLVTVTQFSLPNLLAGRALVPEFIQENAVPEKLGAAVLDLLRDPQRRQGLLAEFSRLHRQLQRDASERAADAVLELLHRRRCS